VNALLAVLAVLVVSANVRLSAVVAGHPWSVSLLLAVAAVVVLALAVAVLALARALLRDGLRLRPVMT